MTTTACIPKRYAIRFAATRKVGLAEEAARLKGKTGGDSEHAIEFLDIVNVGRRFMDHLGGALARIGAVVNDEIRTKDQIAKAQIAQDIRERRLGAVADVLGQVGIMEKAMHAETENPRQIRACRPRNYCWAELMKRVFSPDVLKCARCDGRMRIIAAIHSAEAIRKILDCLGIPSRAPPLARALPEREIDELHFS